MTPTTETDASATIAVSRLATYGLLTAIIASAVNVLVRLAATSLFDVPAGFGPLGWGPVINTTVVGVIGATVVYGLLSRFSSRPNRDFVGVALVVLLLSFVPLFVPPAFLAGAPVSVLGTLAVMHVTTAVAVVGLLPHAPNTGVASR